MDVKRTALSLILTASVLLAPALHTAQATDASTGATTTTATTTTPTTTPTSPAAPKSTPVQYEPCPGCF